MNPSTGTSSSGAEPQPRKSTRRSLREVFDSLSLATQFRLTSIAAVTMTLLAVQVVSALWDTRLARKEAMEIAQSRTASMAARLASTGGGALDDLEGHPVFLAATISLQSGEVQYHNQIILRRPELAGKVLPFLAAGLLIKHLLDMFGLCRFRPLIFYR